MDQGHDPISVQDVVKAGETGQQTAARRFITTLGILHAPFVWGGAAEPSLPRIGGMRGDTAAFTALHFLFSSVPIIGPAPKGRMLKPHPPLDFIPYRHHRPRRRRQNRRPGGSSLRLA